MILGNGTKRSGAVRSEHVAASSSVGERVSKIRSNAKSCDAERRRRTSSSTVRCSSENVLFSRYGPNGCRQIISTTRPVGRRLRHRCGQHVVYSMLRFETVACAVCRLVGQRIVLESVSVSVSVSVSLAERSVSVSVPTHKFINATVSFACIRYRYKPPPPAAAANRPR